MSILTELICFPLSGWNLEDGHSVPAECAINVFKTTLNEFKNRNRCTKDDYRFRAQFGKPNPRKFVRFWLRRRCTT